MATTKINAAMTLTTYEGEDDALLIVTCPGANGIKVTLTLRDQELLYDTLGRHGSTRAAERLAEWRAQRG